MKQNKVDKKILSFINAADIHILILDEDLKIVYVNNTVARFINKKFILYKYFYEVFDIDLEYLENQMKLSIHFVTGTDQIIEANKAPVKELPKTWHSFYINTDDFKGFLLASEDISTEEKFTRDSTYSIFWDLVLRMEKKYQTILNTLPDAVFLHLTNGTIIDVNETACQLYSATKQQLLSCDVEQISGKGFTNSEAYKHILNALKNGSDEFLWMAKKITGEEFPVEVRLKKITFEAKTYIVAIVTNLSQIKNLENKLDQLEKKYFNLFKHSPIGILHLDEDGKIIDCNPKTREIFETKNITLVGNHISVLQIPKLERKFLLCKKEKSGNIFDLKFKNDHDMFLKCHISPLHEKINNKDTYICIFEDITQEKRAILKHFDAERRYHSLVDNSLAGIIIYDKTGSIQFVNKRLEELSGYSLEELKGRKFWEFIHPEFQEKVKTISGKRFAGVKGIPYYEFRAVDKWGNEKWALFSGTPITYFNKPAILGNVIDITDIKKLESQLIHTQKTEALGRMVAGMTHDFNNFLGIIKGYISMLEMSLEKNQQISEYFSVINKTMDNAENLIKDLLLFAKKKKAAKKITDINTLIDQLIPIIRRTVGKRLKFEFSHTSDKCKADINQNQIEQVLLNLVINAADAIEEKGEEGKIIIRTEKKKIAEPIDTYFDKIQPGEYIIISIKDNGTGIKDQIFEKLFDPFFSTKDSRGTGMGLAICAGIVRDHNGYIDVNTMVGKGSTFYLYIPAVE
ncbi:MAG: hypothetical protein Kow00108_11740 [Calditrichia bacterium]